MGMFFGSGPTPSPTSIPLGLPSLEDVFSGDFRVGRPYKKIHFPIPTRIQVSNIYITLVVFGGEVYGKLQWEAYENEGSSTLQGPLHCDMKELYNGEATFQTIWQLVSEILWDSLFSSTRCINCESLVCAVQEASRCGPQCPPFFLQKIKLAK